MGKGVIILSILLLLVIIFLAGAWYYEYLDLDAIIDEIKNTLGI